MENSEKIETWTDAGGRVHKISEMTFAHLENTIKWIKKTVPRNSQDIPMEMTGWEDWEDTNFDVSTPHGKIVAARRRAWMTVPFLEAELERRSHLFHGAF